VPDQTVGRLLAFRRLFGLLAKRRNRQPKQQAACQQQKRTHRNPPAGIVNKTKDPRPVLTAPMALAIRHALTSQ
jgi:hypothetical protein